MPTPISSLFGALLVLFIAFALGSIALRKRPEPIEITLAAGAAIESLLVFLLLLTGSANRIVFLLLAIVSGAAAWRIGRRPVRKPIPVPIAGWAIFAAYGVWYFVNALAPEITPDGITYHLGLPREYVRLGGFPERTAFYDLVPQGMEMLYTVAYSFGRHAAAKLVEFAFFVATLPLILRIGRRLGLSETASLVSAVLFFCAPVVGLTGSSSYNDAAGVFFLLAALYLLLEERLFLAGVCAGFCYAIKMPGVLVPLSVIGWLLLRRRVKPAAIVALGAGLAIAPWMIRATILTGNPIAPLGNRLFPNPYFHIATETDLAAGLRSLRGVRPAEVPWELAFGDRLVGTYGPLLFLLPFGLLAARRKCGVLLWIGAAVLAMPWFTNSGARFLMQSIVLAGFALAMVLPGSGGWAAIALQAVLCWPHVLDRIQPSYSFRLHDFPVAAALGAEPEDAYCRRKIEEYDVARMIQRVTPPDAHTLALAGVAHAYLDRDVAVSWQSAESDILVDTLRLASVYSGTPAYDWNASWPAQDVRGLRFRLPANTAGEWDISEVRILSGGDPLFTSPQWTFTGHPNRWEAPLAFDGNLATRWRTWEPVRANMTFEVNFDHAQRLTSVVLVSHTPTFGVPLEVSGKDAKGEWRVLADNAQVVPRPPQDLKLDASRALRAAGFRYLLVETGSGGNTPIGNAIVGHEVEWGMERAGDAGRFYLLRVR